MKKLKYYTIYIITNLTNDKIYIGCHKTNNLDDGYLGSGKILQRAIKKYGEKSFKKEYLAIFDNAEDMFYMEAKLVNDTFIKRIDTYNLKEGGKGGWDHCSFKGKKHTREVKKQIGLSLSKRWKNDPVYLKTQSENFSKRVKRLAKDGKHPKSFLGKKHTKKTKMKIGLANSIHQKGEKNTWYGTCWIYNDSLRQNKRVKKEDVNIYLPTGWKKGRKMFLT